MAAAADVATETISNVERGVTLPTIDVLSKLTRVIRLDLMRLAQAEPREPEQVSKERQRREEMLQEIARAMPGEKLATLIKIARVLVRG